MVHSLPTFKPAHLLWVALCLPQLLFASLSPGHKAPLREHLLEVNAQWADHLTPDEGHLLVSFADDRQRIQTHLLLVGARLRTQPAEGWSQEALDQRTQLLDALHTYARQGRFPVNTRHDFRIPYFIDDFGTACAVGHLLRESGESSFAERIRQDQNNAYLLDMDYPELSVWASRHGFSADELAWIQPGYLPGVPFDKVGGVEPNGPVTFLHEDPQGGRLFIGGNFSQVGNLACDGLVSWDGSAFTSLGTGPQGTLHDVAYWNGLYYFGGQFVNNGGSNLATWDGSSWTFEQVYQGTVYATEVHNGELYLGGDLTFSGGAFVSHILKHSGGGWLTVGMGLDAPVHCLLSRNNGLFAGGDFLYSGTTSLPYVAQWDGQSWSAVGNDTIVDAPVRTLAEHNSTLYAGGMLMAPNNVDQRFGLASWDGNSWTPMLTYPVSYSSLSPSLPPQINHLEFYASNIYLSGSFYMGGFTPGNDFGTWNQAGLIGVAINSQGLPVHSMALFGGDFYVGGEFQQLNYDTLSYLGVFDVLVGLPTPMYRPQIYPQPASEQVRVQLPASWGGTEVSVKCVDLQGKTVVLGHRQEGRELLLSRNGLAAGRYLLMLEWEGHIQHTVPIQFQ